MNSFESIKPRERNRKLLIVEGQHEKNKLFKLIFDCFSEIQINMDDVWVYGTNIYQLYKDIQDEYGENWFEDDVDLPYIISNKKGNVPVCYKNDFTHILMVFDYERHDPNFSEEKIVQLQKYFVDSTDIGKLYINYPMLESYQDFQSLPDALFEEKRISRTLQTGIQYKTEVKNSRIAKLVDFPEKMKEILLKRFMIGDRMVCETCVEQVLQISNSEKLHESIHSILKQVVPMEQIDTATYQFEHMIKEKQYLLEGKSYWVYMRDIFKEIITHNICKANKLQGGEYQIAKKNLKEAFYDLDFVEVLKRQNDDSRDPISGIIWVLNTCVFVVSEYKFFFE